MNPWIDRFPTLIFRLALVAVGSVALAGVLMASGWTWHEASVWLLRFGGATTVVVAAAWVIGTLNSD